MKIALLLWIVALMLLCSCHGTGERNQTSSKLNEPSSDTTLVSFQKNRNPSAYTLKGNEALGVKVLYFHNPRRCATCVAVEVGASEVVTLLSDSMVSFHSYLIGSPDSKTLEKQFDVEGQSLLLVGQDKILDITNMAFLFARTKPDYYKAEVRKQIEGLLK